MDIEADSGPAVSKPHYTEQPPTNPPSVKDRSKVRVGKSKPAKVKPTTEIGEEDRLTGITIEDSGIQNMNRLIINGLEDLSAEDIWAVGKTLGAETSGDESEPAYGTFFDRVVREPAVFTGRATWTSEVSMSVAERAPEVRLHSLLGSGCSVRQQQRTLCLARGSPSLLFLTLAAF
ncbi:hypothetical protein Ancab_025678 [Ancistrocladus abbreviatus]